MIRKALISILIVLFLAIKQAAVLAQSPSWEEVISAHAMSLEKRYDNEFVNDVFKDNILLTLHYLNGEKKSEHVDWEAIGKPYSFEVKIDPDSVFAFHDGVLPEYKDKVVKTTNSHFSSQEGFKSDGYLIGDGVCHLASLINWAARDAGLEVVSPTNHDFANVPEVPKEYGVSIFASENPTMTNLLQNLYIKNNLKKPVIFKFEYDGIDIKVTVTKTLSSTSFLGS